MLVPNCAERLLIFLGGAGCQKLDSIKGFSMVSPNQAASRRVVGRSFIGQRRGCQYLALALVTVFLGHGGRAVGAPFFQLMTNNGEAAMTGWNEWNIPFPNTGNNSLTNTFPTVSGSSTATVTLTALTATSNVTGRSRNVITNSNQSAGFTEASLYDGFSFPGNAGTMQVSLSGAGVIAPNTVYQVTVIANDTSAANTTVYFENSAAGFVLGTQAASTITMPGNPAGTKLVNSDSRAQLTFNLASNAAGVLSFLDVDGSAANGSRLNGVQLAVTINTWAATGGGSLINAANWDSNGVPAGSAANVVFGNSITAPATVTLDSSASFGSLTFSNSNNFGYALTAGSGGSLAIGGPVTVSNGSNSIMAPVTLSGSDNFTISAGASLNFSAPIAGNGAVVLAQGGSGLLTLSGSNSYSGTTTVNAGTLQIGAGGATGSLATGSTITDNGTLVFSRSNSITQGTDFSGSAITGSGSLTQMGPGTLTLGAANNYSGPTTVSGGALLLNSGSLAAAGAVSVSRGATFGGAGAAGIVTVAAGGILQGGYNGASSLSLAGLTFSGSGGVTMGGLAIANTSSPLISVGSGGLSTSGTNSITISVGSLAGATSGATYQLIGYNSIGGSGTAAFQLATLPSRAVGFLSFPSGLVDLNITGADYLHWSAAASNAWDTTSANWKLNSNGGTTAFINGSLNSGGDTVVFDNAAGPGHSSVALATAVFPSSVTVSSSNNYTFSGSGSLGGVTAVTINGPGSVTIGMSNGYTGGTNVMGGALIDGAANSFGSGPLTVNGGTVNVKDTQAFSSVALGGGLLNLTTFAATLGNGAFTLTGGTLDNISGSPLTLSAGNPQNWNGSFTFLGSNPLNLGAGPVAINNSPTVFVSSGTLTAGGAISGVGALTKNGSGMLTLTGAAAYSGSTTVSNGTLALTNAAAPGSTSFSVASGASLILGAALTTNQSPSFSGDGTVTLNGPASLNINNLNLSGMNADATLDLEFNGNDAALINSGDTPLANYLGTLKIGASSSAQVGNVTIQCNVLTGGGTLGCPVARTIALNLVGGASGTFSGNFSAANGAVVNLTLSGTGTQVLSGNNGALGTVTINSGVLCLQSPTAWIGVAGDAATVSGNGALQLQNCGPLTSAATLNLSGTGVANDGALRNVAGNNAYSGPISLQSDARINSDSGLLTLPGGISGFGNLYFGGAGNISVPSSITVSGVLTMDGSGMLTLAGNNNYAGDTLIRSGVLLLNSGSLNTAGAVSVAGSATFGGADASGAATVAAGGILQGGYSGSGSLALSGLSFGGSASVIIGSLDMSYTSNPVIFADSPGLSTSGANSITISVGSIKGATSGTIYQLIGYNGSIGGTGTAAFQLAPLPSRGVGYLSFPPGLVDLNITGADYLHWSGAISSAWDTTTANWRLNSNGGTATFINGNAGTGGDTVVFDSAAGTGHSSVILATTVYPLSVTVSGSNNYTFSGSGSIAGPAAVTINGPASVTLAARNSYTGGTNVMGGALIDGAANSFGAGVLAVNGGTVNVNNAQSSNSVALGGGLLNLASSTATLGNGAINFTGGTLDNISGSPLTLSAGNPQNWNGNFTFLGSNPLNLGTGPVVVNNSPTVFVSSGTLIAGGAFSAAGALTKNGSGTLILTGVAGYSGSTTVSNGTLALTNATVPGSTSFSVASGASLILGAALTTNQSPSFSGDGTVTLNGPSSLNINNVSLSGMNADSTLDFEFNGTDAALINSGAAPLAGFLGTLNIGSSSNAQVGNVTVQCNVLTGGGTLGCPVARTIALNLVGGATGTFSGNLSAVNGAIVNLTLSGTGTQVLSGDNSGLGTVTINSGVLCLQSSSAWIGVAGSEATVSGNGALELHNCGALISTGATLNLNGTGVANDGALRNVAGNNTYSDPIALQGDSRINSASGLLILAGTGGISGAANLTFGGAGNITVASDVSLGSGTLTMDGGGQLTLAGANTYDGGTVVDAGTLISASPAALPVGSNLIVGQGAAAIFAPLAGQAVSTAQGEIVAVPEPGTLALAAAGLFMGLCLRRKKSR
jgi:fibronectin-binding autotransporter adhesin